MKFKEFKQMEQRANKRNTDERDKNKNRNNTRRISTVDLWKNSFNYLEKPYCLYQCLF